MSDDDGAYWHHGHIRNGSSSMPICFLHIWCTRAGHVGDAQRSSVCCVPVSPQTTHKPLVGVSILKHVVQKNVLDFVRAVRSITHALCALREHCAHVWLEV